MQSIPSHHFLLFSSRKVKTVKKTRNRQWYQTLTVVLTQYEGVHAPQSKHIQEVPGRRAHPAHSADTQSPTVNTQDIETELRDTYITNTDM